jgi:transcriptional regulator with XRE-family HTH domain
VKQEPKTTIASRTHLLRKTLKLTQSEFADKLKLKFGIISAVEVGRTPLTEQNLKMICYEFNVSEQWLRTGEGDMFVDNGAQYESELLDVFRQLSEASQKLVVEHAKGVVELERFLRAPCQPDPA